MGLLIALAITGCATKKDIQESTASLEQRLAELEINESCHGKTLELFLFSIALRNPALQENQAAFTQAQLEFMVAQGDQQNACKKLEALRKKQQAQ